MGEGERQKMERVYKYVAEENCLDTPNEDIRVMKVDIGSQLMEK